MTAAFYVSAVVAVVATAMAITRMNPVHALLYLVVSLLSAAVAFFTLGAPFVAALEVIIYAGAIIVLFLFVVMLLNLGPEAAEQERRWLTPGIWRGPLVLAAVLIAELLWILAREPLPAGPVAEVGPKAVGAALYGPYVLGVELASLLLLSGLIGAYHLGRRERALERVAEEQHEEARAWQTSR